MLKSAHQVVFVPESLDPIVQQLNADSNPPLDGDSVTQTNSGDIHHNANSLEQFEPIAVHTDSYGGDEANGLHNSLTENPSGDNSQVADISADVLHPDDPLFKYPPVIQLLSQRAADLFKTADGIWHRAWKQDDGWDEQYFLCANILKRYANDLCQLPGMEAARLARRNKLITDLYGK